MDKTLLQNGVTVAKLKKLETQVMPRIQIIKEMVERGEVVSERDANFLSQLLQRLVEEKAGVDNYPEWQSFYAGLVALCHEVIEKALTNEKSLRSS
jgi:polyhydroxyalkanoate synthesis regulator phasin